jgi:glycosyltransferase involved in cell wall biosynthesis
MNRTGQVVVAHLTSAHSATDIRIQRKECLSLAAAGYHVVLIAPQDKSHIPTSSLIQEIVIPKARSRLTRMCLTSWRVVAAAVRIGADIYHAHDPELLPWLRVLKWLGKSVVYDMHENVPKAITSKPWIPDPLRKPTAMAFAFIEKLLLRNVPVVFAEESYPKDYAWVRTGAIVRNYPILDDLFAISERPYTTPTVTCLGGITPLRGSVVVLEAVKRCWKRNIAVDLEYIGTVTDEHRRMLLEAVPPDACGQFRILGYVEPDRGWRLLARAHIGMAVLAPIPNYLESVPTKVLEYMALGKAVIASNFPLYKTLVEDTGAGICVDPEDVDTIANAIEYCVTCPQQARAFGDRGRAIARERYSWHVEAEKLSTLYDFILAGS